MINKKGLFANNALLLVLFALLQCIPAFSSIKAGDATVNVGATTTINLSSVYVSTLSQATGISYEWKSTSSAVSVIGSTRTSATIKGLSATTNGRVNFFCSYYINGYYRTMDFYWDVMVVDASVPVSSISLNAYSITLTEGATKQLTATVSPSNATNKGVSWTTNKSSVATVSNTGLVKAISSGEATITCTAKDGSGVSESCKVTVTSNDNNLENGSTFDANTAEGLTVRYQIIDSKAKTCRVYSLLSKDLEKALIIPSSVNGYKVIEIDNGAGSNSKITSVTIPASVNRIGVSSFYDCQNLKTVNGGENITSIIDYGGSYSSSYPFWSTPWYSNQPDGEIYLGKVLIKYKGMIPEGTTLNIKDGTTGICASCFDSQKNLYSVNLPNSITNIGTASFWNTSISSIFIPKNVGYIAPTAFGNNELLESISVDASNNTYDSRNNCNAIIHSKTNTLVLGCVNTKIPNSVLRIDQYSFYGSSIENIVIPDRVDSIKTLAFGSCAKLRHVNLGRMLTFIGTNAFGETALESIDIPENVDSIGINIFRHCDSLKSITVSPLNRIFDSRNNCNAIVKTSSNTLVQGCVTTIIPEDIEEIGKYAFRYTKIKTIVIPDRVKKIADYAFMYSKELKEITIGSSVESFGVNVFSFCDQLERIYSRIENPFPIPETLFKGKYDIVTLYVPENSLTLYYRTAAWNRFENIIPYDPSKLKEVETNGKSKNTIYSISGQLLSKPIKGINIINGKKCVIK